MTRHTKKKKAPKPRASAAEAAALAAIVASAPDDFPLDEAAVCALRGGTRPIHRSTLWRQIRKGEFPAPKKLGPNSNRWTAGMYRAHAAA